MAWSDLWKGRRAPADTEGVVAVADALIAEGHSLEDAGQVDEALQQYRAAVAKAPAHARAHLNVGNALLAKGDAVAALVAYEHTLQLNDRYAPAHYNRGNALARLGRSLDAIDAYRQAVHCDTDFVDAWVALGNVQDDMGNLAGALDAYAQALRIRGDDANVIVNAAGVEHKLGDFPGAERSCRRALAIDPHLALAHFTLGKLLLEQGAVDAALASFRAALRDDPQFAGARVQAYHAANQACDWSAREEDERELVRLVGAGAAGLPPFALINLQSQDAARLQRDAARQFAEGELGPMLRVQPLAAMRSRPERLRIAYLSSDLHEHATMHLLRGVLAAHDRSTIRVAAYSYGRVSDGTTQFVRETCELFRDISTIPDADAAALIAADGADLLVDLKGFTSHSRLGIVAYRPAPVVVSWLGYPGSLGHPRLADWIVGDPVVTPLESAANYSEALALMPHCYQPNDRRRAVSAQPSRTEAGLPPDGFVFCSFNQSYKFTPETLDVWCRLLREVPGSVLWLLPVSGTMMANLQHETRARGVDGDRLVYARALPTAAHLGRLALADLALDTFPCNSHTTGSDALWAGVPMVTRMGDTFASRVAASLLHAVGLPELVVRDWDAYFALARSLALDPERLGSIRRKLEAHRGTHPLFDTIGFTRDLERLFTHMWDLHGQGRREPIVLPPRG
jgi:protein O-GlcNAc transferase